MTIPHLCPWSEPILDALRPILRNAPGVHDPFAGAGDRLGALCDELEVGFTGTELEPEWVADPRVLVGDSTDPDSYPEPIAGRWPWIVTSPVYPNGMADHFEPKDASKRMTYRARLGRPLHENNAGRHSVRGGKKAEHRYWDLHARCVRLWPDVAVVNVKDFLTAGRLYPLTARWFSLLEDDGYVVDQVHRVPCPGNRYGANHDVRVEHESILVAHR